MCLFCREKRSLEEHFPHQNWPIVLSFQLLISTIFSIATPSMYQYVTSPLARPEQLEDSERYWPGLGGTDTDYAWVQSAQPLFETGAILLTIPLANHFPFSFLFFGFVGLASVGGVMYALAQSVWIALLGRGLMGAGVQLGAATIHTYLGEMGTLMDDIRQKQAKLPRKYILYITFSFTLNGGFMIPYALTSVMARFQEINPYRWPGWAVTALAAVLGLLVLLIFKETRPFPCKRVSGSVCSSFTGLKMSKGLRSKFKLQVTMYAFLVGCAYVSGKAYAFLLALAAPVVDNKFGFSVKYTALFMLGTSVGFMCSSFIHLGVKFVKINNRIVLGMCLLLTLFGSLLSGDWQSIGHDNHCKSFNETLHLNSFSGEDFGSVDSSGSFIPRTSNDFNTSLGPSYHKQLIEGCASLSRDGDACYWNQQSVVTGEFCSTCLPACLSSRATVNFYQFGVGAFLLAVAGALAFVFVSAVASEITTIESQGAILSLMVGTGALSRAVSPIWFIESYELTGRHTYFPMAITAGCSLVLLLGLAVLYKNLVPVNLHAAENVMVEATSKFTVIAEGEIVSDNGEDGFLEIWTETPV